MTDTVRISQQTAEALATDDASTVRITQQNVFAMETEGGGQARIGQGTVETLTTDSEPRIRIGLGVVEVIYRAVPGIQIAQQTVEVIHTLRPKFTRLVWI